MTSASIFPTPEHILTQLPVHASQKIFIDSSQKTIINILQGLDPRKLLIVGPCSIHDLDAAREYAIQLHRLSEAVADEFFIVMRVYLEKPRTLVGWKGFLFDPHLDGSNDMLHGISEGRKFLLELASMRLPAGSELLELSTYHYLSDLLSWGCVGARTSSSQPHRQMASSLPFAIGFKNTINGDLDCPLNAIHSASFPHTFLGMNTDGQVSLIHSQGNQNCHIILRGQSEKPNFDSSTVHQVIEKMQRMGFEKKIMIDCSHDNCRKIYQRQISVFESFISQLLEGRQELCGAMIESHLFAGCQPILGLNSNLKYGVSITDPCLDFVTTEQTIKHAALILKRQKKSQVSDSLCNIVSVR